MTLLCLKLCNALTLHFFAGEMTIFCGSDIETMIPEEPPDSDDGHRTEDPPRDIDPT